MQYDPTLTDQKFDSPISIESSTRYILGRMQYAPTLTDQKLDFPISIESSARYVLRRMQYSPTPMDQKLDSLLSIELPTRYVLRRMPYSNTLTDQKIDSPLKPPTRSDPFFVYRCRGVLHTPHKCPWQWANDSSSLYIVGRMQYSPTKTWYVSIKYVLIESFSCQEFDSLSFIESYTRKKSDSPLKSLTHNDPFLVYRCRSVCHTPHKCPW